MSLSRRSFVASAVASAVQTVAAQGARRPNILWISCEDISPSLGCYGEKAAITPNLDKFATEGVRYDRAFSVAGVCAPSRSSMATGMYPSTLGSHLMRCSVSLPPFVKCFSDYLRQAGYYCTNNAKTDYNFPVPKTAWDLSSAKAHWRLRPAGKPFFSVFNLEVTHESRVMLKDEKYEAVVKSLKPEERRNPFEIPLPAYFPDTAGARMEWAHYHELITVMDRQFAAKLKELEADSLADDTIVFFWSDHGHANPRGKRYIYEAGTRVPLIVRIPEKYRVNGQGKPGSVDNQLLMLMDLGPTVLNLAGAAVPGHMQGRAFLGPRLSPQRRYVHAIRDRMDERYDCMRGVRDSRFHYIRNYEPQKPYWQPLGYPEPFEVLQDWQRLKAVNQLSPEAALFMRDTKPVEELFDVETDPFEVRNLADAPEHASTLKRMRDQHERWKAETRDLGLVPEAELAAREQQYGNRWSIARQPSWESLRGRLEAANALLAPGPLDGEALTKALEDEDGAVRYWAYTALGTSKDRVETHKKVLAKALSDATPIARVAAARALLARLADGAAFKVLVREAKSKDEWIRLAALQALDETGQTNPPAPAVFETAKSDPNEYVKRIGAHGLLAVRR